MTATIKGNVMCAKLQNDALRQFVHRFTGNHKPTWAKQPMPNGNAYPLQFKDDSDWLANTFFHVTEKGELALRRDCISSPTWPNNPELRK